MQKLWSGNQKPAIVGESTNSNAHINLWATLCHRHSHHATHVAIQRKLIGMVRHYFGKLAARCCFYQGNKFCRVDQPDTGELTVTGATVYGISSDQITFGWITGTFSGKSLSATGLANGGSTVEWWNTTAGTMLSSSTATVTGGALTTTIPTSTEADIAFKIISPAGVGVIQQAAPCEGEFQTNDWL